MNRSEFLRSCSGGLCACIGVQGLATGTLLADTASPEDWRLGFIRRRYSKLISMLSDKMDPKALDQTLRELGAFCSSTDPRLAKYRGDVDGYCAHLRQTASGDDVVFDRAGGVLTVTSPVRADCFCPWISVKNQTPRVVCNCSLGWQQATWEAVTGKRVQVDLKESVLRGGERCVFEVRILQDKA